MCNLSVSWPIIPEYRSEREEQRIRERERVAGVRKLLILMYINTLLFHLIWDLCGFHVLPRFLHTTVSAQRDIFLLVRTQWEGKRRLNKQDQIPSLPSLLIQKFYLDFWYLYYGVINFKHNGQWIYFDICLIKIVFWRRKKPSH